MNCVIYASNDNSIPMFEQHNYCAEYAKKKGYTVEKRYFDIRGDKLHEAVNQCLFYGVSTLLVYDKSVIGNPEDFLFYNIFLTMYERSLVACK